jgi:hypothetical protein
VTTEVKDEKQADPKPNIPGGQHTAMQNPDGTWDIGSVPIFAQHKVKFQDEEIEVGKDWLLSAKAKEDARFANDKYLPPLHIHHHGARETRRAGFFRSKSVAQANYQGKPLWMTFADLINVPDDVYQMIRAGELPYRSVEVHSLKEPEISSLALLDDEVPFFRLSLLTIGKEIPAEGLKVGEAFRAMNPESQPLYAYRALGNAGSNVLMNLDGKHLRRQEMPEEEKKDEEKKEEKAADQGELVKALNSVIATLQSVVEGMGSSEEKPSDDEAPAPAENLSAEGDEAGKANKGSDAGKGADFAAKLAGLPEESRGVVAELKGEVDALRGEREIEKAVFAATKELVTYGLDQEKTAKTLSDIAKKAGIPAMQSYAQGVKDNGQADPASGVEGDEEALANLPKEMQVFANQGEGVLEKAMQYSKEFDEAKRHGLKMDFGRQRYVADCLAVAGHKIEIPEGKED